MFFVSFWSANVASHAEKKRAHYDRFGLDEANAGMGVDGEVDLEDLLAQMFMGGMSGMPGMDGGAGSFGSGSHKRDRKGKDVIQEYEVSLEELYKGKTVKLNSTRNAFCSACKG